MKLSIQALAAFAAAVLATSTFAQTSFPEIEPNSVKAQATAVTGITAGDSITGTCTGVGVVAGDTALTTSDVFRVRNAALPLGIYRHRLTVTTSTTSGHTGSIRGLNQTGTTGTASTGGTPGTVDSLVQTASTTSVNPPPRTVQWYGFGKQEELYYRIQGVTATTAAYAATLSTSTIAATVIVPAFEATSPITITTIGQTTADTEIRVYDGNLDAIPGYGNDDDGPAGAGGLLSELTRNYAPGTYYLAVSRNNLAWSLPSASDDDSFGIIMDFPNVLVCSSTTPTTTIDDRDFLVTAANGNWSQSNQVAGPDSFSVQWFQFTVANGAPPIPPPNDACANAISVGTGGTLTGSVLNASNDGLASCDPGGAASRDVWYSYNNSTAFARILAATTCGTTGITDTVLSVYSACGGAELACNDTCGGAPCGGPTSCVSGVNVNPGQTVLIRVSDKALGGAGGFTLVTTITAPPPPNDDCSTPTAIGPGLTPFSTDGATTGTQGQTETLCNFTGGPPIARDQWFTYMPTATGTVTVTTCSFITTTDQDTKIAVYAGAGCPTAGTAIACNDDAACTGFSALNTTLTFNAVCGTLYTLQVGHYAGTANNSTGQFSVTQAGTPCSTPTVTFCDGSAVGTTCVLCGNNGTAGRGCGNFNFNQGARLSSTGIASTTADTLILTCSEIPGPGLFFQANGVFGSPAQFGDGMLCAGVGIARMGVVFSVAGSASYPGGTTPFPISSFGANPGDTKYYQCWYRDAEASWCPTATFNTSNGISLVWQ